MVEIEASFECNGCHTLFIAPKSINPGWSQYTLIEHNRVDVPKKTIVDEGGDPREVDLPAADRTSIKASIKTQFNSSLAALEAKFTHNTFTLTTIEDTDDVLEVEIKVSEVEAGVELQSNPDLTLSEHVILKCPTCDRRAYEVQGDLYPK